MLTAASLTWFDWQDNVGVCLCHWKPTSAPLSIPVNIHFFFFSILRNKTTRQSHLCSSESAWGGLTLSLVTPLRDLSPEEAHAETCQHVSKTTWEELPFSPVVLFWMQRKKLPGMERWNMFAPGLCRTSRRTRVRCIFLSLLGSWRELIFKHTGPIRDGGWCTNLICIMFPLVLEHSWCKSALMMLSGLSENHYQG